MRCMEGFPSGQRGQTVNLLAPPSVVRIHPPPPFIRWLLEQLAIELGIGCRDVTQVSAKRV